MINLVDPTLLYDLSVSGPIMYWDYSENPAVLRKPMPTYSSIGALGNEASGQAVYAANCASGHGANGTDLDIAGASVGELVCTKPNEVWLKAKFGESGTGMKPGLVTATSDLQDLYAALVNTTNVPDIP